MRADERSAEFFAGAGRDELMIKRCGACSTWQPPTSGTCPQCGSDDSLTWAKAAGHGRLVSWAIVHGREADAPLAVPALVELDEGPWLSTGLYLNSRADLAGLRAGQPVEASFLHPEIGESYPIFTLAPSVSAALLRRPGTQHPS